MIAAARDGRRPHGHANGHIFLREEPRATCKTRMKNGRTATLRAAPASTKHSGRLQHRRRNSRVEKLSAARPARQCVNERQWGRGLFETRGAGGVAGDGSALTPEAPSISSRRPNTAPARNVDPPRTHQAPRRAQRGPLCARGTATVRGGA